MILSLTIAWCLLSIPAGIVLGKCMRLGLSGAVSAGTVSSSRDEPRRDDVLDVPRQRRPQTESAQLQDV